MIAQALGQYQATSQGEKKAKFKLDKNFRKCLNRKLGLAIPDECDKVFVAMDYHLDCIVASICLLQCQKDVGDDFENYENNEKCPVIKGTQQDIDLLVAFHSDKDDKYHLIFIEAKAYSGWKNKEFSEKTVRLMQIFGDDGKKHDQVIPYFCLMGPKYPDGLNTDFLSCTWMKRDGELKWLNLRLPDERRVVERTDSFGNAGR